LITKNGPAVYVTFGLSGVIVPLSGVAAKLYIAIKVPAAQSKKAPNARGLTAPDWEPSFIFIMPSNRSSAKSGRMVAIFFA